MVVCTLEIRPQDLRHGRLQGAQAKYSSHQNEDEESQGYDEFGLDRLTDMTRVLLQYNLAQWKVLEVTNR